MEREMRQVSPHPSERQSLDPEILEPIKIAVFGQQGGHAAVPAQRHDLGVEDKVADGANLANGVHQPCRIVRARPEYQGTFERQQSRHRTARFDRRVRRIEQPGMRDHPEKLADAKHRNAPWAGASRKQFKALQRRPVLQRFLAMRVDKNIRVDRDQSRASIDS